MSFDFDGWPDREPPVVRAAPMRPDDLEAIVTLLELAAIYLTPEPGSEFTRDELLAKAHEVAGDDLPFRDSDALIVLASSRFLKRRPGGMLCLR